MSRPLLLVAVLAVPLAAQTPAAPPTTTEATFVCEGRVVDLRGEGVPVSRLRVVDAAAPDVVLAKSTADGEGWFRFGKVPQRSGLSLEATADGRCTARQSVSSTSGMLTVKVHDGAVVRGTLHDRAGKPVANTLVRASLECRVLFGAYGEGRTDAEGRFELHGVPLGPCRIGAWIAGEGVAEQELLVHGDREVALCPGNEARTELTVRFVGLPPDGPPIDLTLLPYTNHSLTNLPPPLDRVEVRGGTWHSAHLPDRDYTLRVRAKHVALTPQQPKVVAGQGPHVVTFAVTPLGAEALTCKAVVRDADDQPVAGLPFVLRPANTLEQCAATSDADGALAFVSPFGPGTKVIVYTTDPRWVTDQAKDESFDRRGLRNHETQVDPGAVLALRVVPACTITGRLCHTDGRPVGLARVDLQERRANRMPEWMSMARATTGRDGEFRFEGLHHLDDDVRVSYEGAAGFVASEPLQIAAPGTKVSVPDLTLVPPATVEGIVRDAAQQPAGGVRVWLRDWDMARGNQRSGSVVEAITDRAGRYRFVGVPPGGAYLQMFAGVGRDHPRTKAVEPFEVEAGTTYGFDLQLPGK
jgi:hypothetical protein